MSAAVKAYHPKVLILASRYDLACDYIVSQLCRRSVSYLRINTEDFASSIVELDPIERRLAIERSGYTYCVSPQSVASVLFRRPVFLRDYGDDRRPADDRFAHVQWAAFERSVMLFKEARWVNDPVATYRAEHKAVQLSIAAELGFAVPATVVTNSPDQNRLSANGERVAIKGLDTVLLRDGSYEMFGFTTFDSPQNLDPEAWRSAPATVQEAVGNKLDIRVTVVGQRVFAAQITTKGNRISDDWRAQKGEAEFRPYDLPIEVAERCIELVRSLGLHFGAIDLARSEDEYYFLEINPTGEWAWLVDSTGLPIDCALADALCCPV